MNNYMTDQRGSAHYWSYEYDIDIPFSGKRAERALLVAALVLLSTPRPNVESLLAMLEKEMPSIASMAWVAQVEGIREIVARTDGISEHARDLGSLMAQSVLKKGTLGNPQR